MYNNVQLSYEDMTSNLWYEVQNNSAIPNGAREKVWELLQNLDEILSPYEIEGGAY